MKMLKYFMILLVFLGVKNVHLEAQNIVFDQCVDLAGLKLCPSVYNEKDYYYLVNKIELGRHPNGKPQFSFIKFYKEKITPTGKVEEFMETDDVGGVVTALFKLQVSEDAIKNAEQELKRIRKDGKIVGAIMPKSGRVSIVSAFAKEDGEIVKRVVGLGQAPIIEGSKVAVSIHLNKQGADQLWATFAGNTPDFSFQFELDLEGFWERKRMTLEADWDKIYSHKNFQAALATPIFSAEIRKTLDDLYDKQNLKVNIIGEDAVLEKMLDAAYNKISNLMFDKVAGTGVMELNKLNGAEQKSMLDRATEALKYHRKESMEYNTKLAELHKERATFTEKARASAKQRRDSIFAAKGKKFVAANGGQKKTDTINGNSYDLPQYQSVPGFSIAASYVMKDVKQKGRLFLDFNKRVKDIRTESFAENLGSFINRSSCPECFKKVDLFDPAYQQHVIRTRLDANSMEDFKNYINNVDIQLRKKHKNGTLTVKGLSIDRSRFSQDNNEYILQYGWREDGESIEDRVKWLEYDYKITWSFFGGHVFETDWNTDYNAASVTLTPPLQRKRIDVEVFPDELEDVKAIEIKIFYKINGKEEIENKTLNLKKEEDLSTSIYIFQPLRSLEYEFQIGWLKKGSYSPEYTERISSTIAMISIDHVY